MIFSRGASGVLTQDGCISSGGVGGCASAYGLRLPTSVSVSPDGKNLYAASAGVRNGADGVTIFDRSASGNLSQKDGTAGCVSESGSDGNCADGVALRGANSVTVSADGKSVYATSSGDAYTPTTSSGVATFDRDSTTGVLTQKAGTAGCVVDDNTVAGLTSCADGVGLDHAAAVSVSPDGTSAYVASSISDNIATFDRDTATGGLAQNAAGNVSLDGVSSVTVSPDGANVYGGFNSGVATFDRAAATGLLSQREEDSLSGSDSVAVSPDGRNAYVAAGGSAVHVFDRDVPPDTTITSGPSGLISDNTPTFGFSSSEAGSTFECKVDNGSFAPCSGPGDTHTTAVLADGPHDFQVRAIDSTSNTDPTPATRSFTVDTIPPDTTISSGPTGLTNDNDPSFSFSSEAGASLECRLDGPGAATGSFGSCTSPKAYANLADGSYTFQVRATDQAANTDPTPATRSFTVDTTAPNTKITKKPKSKIKTKGKKAKVTVSFKSEAGAKFKCQFDKANYKPCSSPYEVKAKGKGGKGMKHTISVRAIDVAGNIGKTSTVKFRVVKKG